jgi:putative heme transporter
MSRRDKIIWILGIVAVAVVFIWVLPSIASYAEIWATLRSLTAGEFALLLGLGLLAIAANGWSAVVALPGLSWFQGAQSTLCGNFLTALFPTGADLAVRFAMYRSWGFESDQVTTSIALAWIGRYLTVLLLPIAGTSALLITGRGGGDEAFQFGLGLLAFALLVGVPWLLLRREDLAHRFAHRLQRLAIKLAGVLRRPAPADLADRVLRTRVSLRQGVRTRAPVVVFAQIIATVASFFVLFASLRAVGLGPELLSGAEVFYAYAIGTIAGLLPITPGNIGVTELILVGVRGLGADELNAQIIAATLLFRIFVWLLPIPLGAASLLWWRSRPPVAA